MKKRVAAIAIGLLGTGAGAAQAQRPARVTSGLAFALTLTDGGRSISSDRVSLKIPDTKGQLAVRIDGFDLAGGAFSAPLRLENGTDAELYALRVDYASATESSAASAGTGRTSPGVAAPLTWPKLGKGETSTTLEFRASPVVFSKETTLVTVLGTVSGVAIVGDFRFGGAGGADGAATIEVDPSGDLVVTDSAGKTLRSGPDGSAPREIRNIAAIKRPKPVAAACAPHRAAGLVCAEGPEKTVWTVRDDEVSILDASGATLRSFRLGGAPVVDLAFSKTGRAYLLRRDGGVIAARSF